MVEYDVPFGMNMYDTLSMSSHTCLGSNVNDPANLRIVAFVQNYETKEVYQAADDQNFLLATEIEFPEEVASNTFLLFPNPTNANTQIRFEYPIDENYRIELYDNMGKLIEVLRGNNGQVLTLSTEGLSRGVYHVRVSDGNGFAGIQRLIVQ